MKFEFSSGRHIEWDTDPDFNPREDCTTICTMYCTDNRYFSLDAVLPSDFDPEEEKAKGNIVLPIYALVHSGVSLSTTPFNDPWDSGLCGYAVATPDQIMDCYGYYPRTKEDVESNIRNEVIEMNAYFDGNYIYIALYDERGNYLDCVDGVMTTTKSDFIEALTYYFELTEEEKSELDNFEL